MVTDTSTSLSANSRLYVLLSTFFISLLIISSLRLTIASDQLFYIRSEQAFGLLSVVYWYGALIISPLGSVVGAHRLRHLAFARRAIGVSAAYFVLLHGGIAVWGQLGGLGSIQFLPSIFIWSLIGGTFAAIILLIMAATSFDRVVRRMTYARWKALHRIGYIGFIVVLLHIWTIGTHTAYLITQISASSALLLLAGLELFRLTNNLNNTYFHLTKLESITVYITSLVVVVVLLLALPTTVGNYHSQHTSHETVFSSKGQQ
jgi:DMSO/TMAO reductase YedYZ heme-binding membrane subunit